MNYDIIAYLTGCQILKDIAVLNSYDVQGRFTDLKLP
jgi:hypothetical protein